MSRQNEKIRVCMFSYYFPPQYSGAAKQAISLARYLRIRGHEVEFVTVRWPGLSSHDTYEGFAVSRLEQGRGSKHREIRLWWNLLRYVSGRRHDFDIFHSHGAYYTNSIIGPLARLAGRKSLVKASLAGNDLHELGHSLPGRIQYRFLRMVDAYIAISHDIEKEFRATGLSPEKIHYLPNGVDTERFRPAGSEKKKKIRQILGLPHDRPVVLTVGVFDERKNIGWLMEEWARNNAFDSGAILLAAGPQSREDTDGAFISSLQGLASGNPDILRMMDHVDFIENYYQAADLFILPSYSEGMPNVVLEAMASGLPCVATRVSGIHELVRDGENGWTYDPCDAAGLKKAIQNVFQNDYVTMGRRSRIFAEERFTLERLAQSYEELYLRLMSQDRQTAYSEALHA